MLPQTNITTLRLVRVELDASCIKELAKVLPKTKIHTLQIEENNLFGGGFGFISHAGVSELVKMLPQSHLTTLGISGVEIPPDRDDSELDHPELTGNHEEHNCWLSEFAKVVAKIKLTHVLLKNSWFDLNGIKDFVEIVPETRLKKLCLQNDRVNYLDDYVGDNVLIADALKTVATMSTSLGGGEWWTPTGAQDNH